MNLGSRGDSASQGRRTARLRISITESKMNLASDPEPEKPPRKGTHGDRLAQKPADFDTLVETYYGPLYRFALALTRCETEAIDLTQHTFYTWACKGYQLRNANKVKVWLFSVLRHEFLKRKRYETRFVQSESSIELACAEEEEGSTDVVAGLDGSAAQDALLSLDELHREPLALFYLQQHSYQQIADILDIPIGTVMSRIWRGKAKLRKVLSRQLKQQSDI